MIGGRPRLVVGGVGLERAPARAGRAARAPASITRCTVAGALKPEGGIDPMPICHKIAPPPLRERPVRTARCPVEPRPARPPAAPPAVRRRRRLSARARPQWTSPTAAVALEESTCIDKLAC